MKPWVLDICCCAGGATRGYQRAGFNVLGVDILDRPRYVGEDFIQADALRLLRDWTISGEIRRFSLIHMSWPCQEACTLVQGTHGANANIHPQLVPPGRRLAQATGLPWVIEQPQGHGGLIRTDLRLCMDMFPVGPPPWVQRHRDFELDGFSVPQPPHARGGRYKGHRGRVAGWRHGVLYDGPYIQAYGHGGGKGEISQMQHALGIDWTDVREELTEAIPPAYTEYIGRHFLGTGKTWYGLPMTDNITDTQSTQSTDTQNEATQNEATQNEATATETPAPAKPKPPLPVFKQNDTVFIYRGKHRGQNGTVIVAAENDQYAVKTDSGATVMLSAGALRAPDAPSLTPDALAGILTDVNDTLGGPQKHVINKVVAAIEEDFPGFAEVYARNSALPVAV